MQRNWTEVGTPANVTTARREYGSGILTTTGVLKLNTNSSADWDAVLRATKLDPATGLTKFFVDGKLVAAWAVPHGTAGSSPFRQSFVKGGKIRVITQYLHGVFEEHPDLRPASKCRVAVTRETGDDGIPYLVINLASQLAVRTTPRDGGEPKDKAEKEAAAGKLKKPARKAPPAPPEAAAEPEDEETV